MLIVLTRSGELLGVAVSVEEKSSGWRLCVL